MKKRQTETGRQANDPSSTSTKGLETIHFGDLVGDIRYHGDLERDICCCHGVDFYGVIALIITIVCWVTFCYLSLYSSVSELISHTNLGTGAPGNCPGRHLLGGGMSAYLGVARALLTMILGNWHISMTI